MTDTQPFPWNEKSHKEYYTAVGYLCAQWNTVNRLYRWRASDLMRSKRTYHDILFRHLGTVAIGEFLKEYAAVRIKSKQSREQIEFVVKYVNACRTNRNAIVHGRADLYSDQLLKAIPIRQTPDQRRASPPEFMIGLSDIARVCEEIETAGQLVVKMSPLLNGKGVTFLKRVFGDQWRAILHAKPPLPKFVVVSPQTHPTPPVRPRSSRK